ncbi:MAG: ABC transporter permease [Candidatus Adiutrix sp.]|jgi:putative ABC transport system permease protein|nr:ABC transporter permease [Candidatus Adiutrix sp.]
MGETRGSSFYPFLVWRLALADLGHEKLLSLCMVLAVASIMAPLLLLFGLKFGTIETLRYRLLEDPKNREIRPLTSRAYGQAWFTDLASWPEVAFVVPYTRQISASLDAYGGDPLVPPVTLEIVPTGPGDPWLAGYNLPVPARGGCVLSKAAAESLGLSVGDTFLAAAKRLQGAAVERANTTLTVTGIFESGGPVTKSIFVPLSFLEDVERYKDGQGVPELGWSGARPLARPVFNSLLVQSRETLDSVMEFRLINNTGFTSQTIVDRSRASELAGRELPEGQVYYLLSTTGEPARLDNLRAVANLLRNGSAIFYPLAESLTITLKWADGSEGEFTLAPAGAWTPAEDLQQPSRNWRKLQVAEPWPEGAAALLFQNEDSELSFPVEVELAPAAAPPHLALAPPPLLGTLAQARRRALTYDPIEETFLLGRRAYAGFRLYARELEGVAALQKKLEAGGLSVATEAARIEEIVRLDRYLNLIFWLIAAGTVVGGAASLLSNIYAGLERKRRELGVLRLLGLAGFAFLRFPLYSSIVLTSGGFAVSLGLFTGLALTINRLFQSHLRPGESLCRLAPEHLLAALALCLLVSAAAGLVAAVRAARIEPAEALRDE